MKNKFTKILLVLILSLNFFTLTNGKEFSFSAPKIEVSDNGNVYRSLSTGRILTNNQIEIISNSFEYIKKTNKLKAAGEVELIDTKNQIIINAEKIFYLKNDEKIYTVGKTTVKISNEYILKGYDIILLRNEEMLKGEKIEIITISKKNKSDKLFFENGFFDLKEKKFLAKNINIEFHKTLFDNNENDPRINAVSAIGDEFNTYFRKGVFTTCKKKDKCPPWKIRSGEFRHDKIKKQIIYKDAWLDIYDFPIVYFPRFFHPDPTVKRQSGFLKPELGSSQNLGRSVYAPYFFVISDDKDMTLKPRLFSDNKFVLHSEYRQKTNNSLTIADFSFAKGHSSNLNDKNDNRSHFFSNTNVNLDLEEFINSTLEIDYETTSNDNYLKLFNLESPLLQNGQDVLESKVELSLEHQEYDLETSIEMYETLDGANSDRYEYVLPTYDFTRNFNIENISGGFNFNTNGNNTLNATNITTSIISNNLNYTSGDNYFNDVVKSNYEVYLKNMNAAGKNNPHYKSSPQSELTSAYLFNTSLPLTKNTEKTFDTLEPRLSFRFSPHDMKNNSNLERRVDMNNIYNINRLGMDNSYEGGESLTVGFDFKKEKVKNENKIKEIEDFLELKLATIFRNSNEKNIPTGSTLDRKKSNIFGQFNYKPTSNISLNYDFSINNDLNAIEYNSINTKIDFDKFSTQFNFLEETSLVNQSNIIENISTYKFDEQNNFSFQTRRNKKLNLTEYYNLNYEYKNDCLTAGIQYRKNYYNDDDIKPVEELFFTISIVPLTTFSPDKMALN